MEQAMSALSEPDRILDFGAMLRDWRSHRGLSQLSLSMRSGISQRHISCLETGRARPSRPMVLALADALAVPLRERNALLARSGFAPAYGAAPLDAEALRMFREAVDLALAHHEPYPALVLDGRWNLVKLNGAALALFGRCVDPVAALAAIGSPASYQVVRLCLDDRGLRPFIVNWQELVYSFLLRARQGLLHNPGDAELKGLIDEILAHPDAPRRWHAPDWTTPPTPAINMVLDDGETRWSLFTMLAHFGAPQHVTVEELSVELFYPADEATKARLLDAAAGRSRG
jgi:transcriptional regulator with XRE-family HTH domain